MRVRNIQGEDYVKIHSVLNDWWGGREHGCHVAKIVLHSLSRNEFIIEEEGETLGFYADSSHKRIKRKRTFILSVSIRSIEEEELHRHCIRISLMSHVQITVKL